MRSDDPKICPFFFAALLSSGWETLSNIGDGELLNMAQCLDEQCAFVEACQRLGLLVLNVGAAAHAYQWKRR